MICASIDLGQPHTARSCYNFQGLAVITSSGGQRPYTKRLTQLREGYAVLRPENLLGSDNSSSLRCPYHILCFSHAVHKLCTWLKSLEHLVLINKRGVTVHHPFKRSQNIRLLADGTISRVPE